MKNHLLRLVTLALAMRTLAACAATSPPVEVIYGGTEHVCRCECPAPLTAVRGDAGYELRMAIVH
jgi:hypothetical protein